MKLKEVDKIIEILSRYRLDENNNQRPEVVDCLLLLEREKITRMIQARNMRDNFQTPDIRY